MRGVQPPADAGAAHPPGQARQAVLGEAEAGGDGGHVEQRAKVGQSAAVVPDAQQPLHRAHQRAARARRQVGDVEGDVARVVAAVLAEDRADRRREVVDRGHHHDDVARAQGFACVLAGEQGEELVVEDLELAHRAVGEVEDDRAVRGRHGRARMLGERGEVADVALDLDEQRGCGAVVRVFVVVEEVDAGEREARARLLGVVEGVELAHEVARLAAPGGEQGVGVEVHRVQPDVLQLAPLAQRMAAARDAQPLAPVQDVGPVEAAGVGDGKQHLGVARQRGEQLQRGQRHVGHAEEHDAARQGGGRARGGVLGHRLQRGEHAVVQLRPGECALLRLEFVEHALPQPRLPALILGQRGGGVAGVEQDLAPLAPGVEPVGPVHLVLVVEVGDAQRELEAAAGVVLRQIAGDRREARLGEHLGQQPHQPPGERGLVQRRARRHLRAPEHLAVGLPLEARRQLHRRRRAHPRPARDRHLHPLGHAVALHQDHLGLERRERMLRQPAGDGVEQGLDAVAVQGDEAGGEGLGGKGGG